MAPEDDASLADRRVFAMATTGGPDLQLSYQSDPIHAGPPGRQDSKVPSQHTRGVMAIL